jgi:biopolymer transport protein ExbD
MIDVTFLLLIYFIVSTVISSPEDQVVTSITIEKGSEVDPSLLEPQVITVGVVDAKPAYTIGNKVLFDRKQLAAVLSSLLQEPGVVIKVKDGAHSGFAIAAIQEARKAGFEKVTYVPLGQ